MAVFMAALAVHFGAWYFISHHLRLSSTLGGVLIVAVLVKHLSWIGTAGALFRRRWVDSGDLAAARSPADLQGRTLESTVYHFNSWAKAQGLLLRAALAVLQVSPAMASCIAYRRFFRPRRSRPRPIDAVDIFDVRVNNERVRVYQGGEGPGVLVVHGWESSAACLDVLIQTLRTRGFRVTAFDMPAHGHSAARHTDIRQITKVIKELEQTTGPFVAAIGHSFGGVCLANAIRGNLKIARLVLISTPSSLTGMIDKYCRTLGILPRTKARLVQAIGQRLESTNLERDYDVGSILENSDIGTLVVHDRRDRLVPLAEGWELSQARADIEFRVTEDLGHSGVIRNPKVIDECISFISHEVP